MKNACKLEFADNLWLPFLDKLHSDIVVFAIITFHIYNILVSIWKHRIGPIDIFTFNEEIEFISNSIIELIHIDESSHENTIIILPTKRNKKPNCNHVRKDDNVHRFELSNS